MNAKGSVLPTIVLLISAAAAAQQAPQPPATPGQIAAPARDAAKADKPTGVIRGRVTVAGSGTPIRRAQVSVFAADVRHTSLAQTDNEGRFEIRELPAGRYTVTANKAGFVQVQYGQRRPGFGSGTPLELAVGQVAERVILAMPRGAAITGRVVDDAGEPMAGVDVAALRYAFHQGRRRIGQEGMADRTDDEGAYRLFGLPAGEYYVRATVDQASVSAANAVGLPDPFTPTFYPGTPGFGEAQRVTAKAGQTTPNVSFAISTSASVSVSGRVIDSRGQPASGMVMLGARNQGSPMGHDWSHHEVIKPDGTFRLVGVTQGSHTIRVEPMGLSRDEGRAEYARVEITVAGTNLENLLLTTAPAGAARGRIVTDEGTPPPLRPLQLQFFTMMADPDEDILYRSQDVTVNDDWSFEIKSVIEPVLIRYAQNTASEQSWSLRHVRHDGVDVIDRGIAVPPGGVLEGVEIVVTQKVTEVSGRVTGDRDRPATDATLVVFASNRERWMPQSRYIRTARPDTSGTYRLRLVPDEEYFIVAVRDLEDGQHGDPEFLDRAVAVGTRFSIAEGEGKVVDVKVIDPP